MAIYNKYTEEEIVFLKLGTHTVNECAKILNRHPVSIRTICKKLNIKIKKANRLTNKVNNHDFFKIWTKDMAYIVGFLAADGCLIEGHRNNKSISIGLSIKDIDHLTKINKIIDTTYDIKTKKSNFNTYICMLNISSHIMFEDLINIGVTKRKSLTLDWISKCPKELISHFVRGYFDGDGCFSIKRNNNLYCSVVGTYNFLSNMKNIYQHDTNLIYGSIVKCKNYFSYQIAGIYGPISFGDWIYQDSSDNNRMNRKFKIYNDFKNKYIDATPRYSHNKLNIN